MMAPSGRWGDSGNGKLGIPAVYVFPQYINAGPLRVPGLSGVVAISAGETYSLALKSDGTVWAWGDSYTSSRSDKTPDTQHIPTQEPGLSQIIAISAGRVAPLALKADGAVWMWGSNASCTPSCQSGYPREPRPVAGLSEIVAMAPGPGYYTALKADGTRCGRGDTTSTDPLATALWGTIGTRRR